MWIFLSVFGYVVTNCTYIGTSLDPRFSLFFVVCVSVSGYIIGKSSLGISILVIGYIITHCTCICPVSWSVFFSLSHSMPISVFGYIVSDCNYVGTSPDRRFSLSLSLSFFLILSECVYQCPSILSLIVGVDVRLLIRVFFSLFPWRFLLLFGYIFCDWLYVYRYVSWNSFLYLSLSPSPSLSFSLSVSVSRYIIGNFIYMNKRVQLTQRVIALLKMFFNFCVYTHVSWFIFLSLSLSLNVCNSVCLYYDSL